MVEVSSDQSFLRVHLRPMEKLGAFHGDVLVAVDRITRVRVVADAWSELRGIRAPGTGWPGVIALGTRRGTFGKDFAAVYGHRPGVVIEMSNAEFERIIVSCDDPDRVAAGLHFVE